MEIAFRTSELRQCYEDVNISRRKWGAIAGKRYVDRINALLAADNLKDLLALRAFRLHPLRSTRSGQYSMALDARWRLIFTEEADTLTIVEVSNHYDD